MAAKRTIPVILLSGMAADERLFDSQLEAFPNVRVQPWIPPLPKESLRAYARRLAKIADPGKPCLVGGASFGGVVAMEMATFLPAECCILIGSLRSSAGLPGRWRLLYPLMRLGPDVLQTFLVMVCRRGQSVIPVRVMRYLRHLTRNESAFERWAICAILCWRRSGAAMKVPTFHIHGDADDVFPIELARPDRIVQGGLHALPVFSPVEVNSFLAEVMEKYSPDS